jgi:hypothetical protein
VLRRCLLSAALLAVLAAQGWAAGPTVSVGAGVLSLAPGETMPVSVKIADVQNVYGFEMELKFDPSVVQVVDADPNALGVQLLPGDFLSSDLIVRNSADNAVGAIQYAVTQLNPSVPKSGSGTLFTLNIKGGTAGKSGRVEVVKALFATRDGEPIAVSTTSAEVAVAANATAVPSREPSVTMQPSRTATVAPPTATPSPVLPSVGTRPTTQPVALTATSISPTASPTTSAPATAAPSDTSAAPAANPSPPSTPLPATPGGARPAAGAATPVLAPANDGSSAGTLQNSTGPSTAMAPDITRPAANPAAATMRSPTAAVAVTGTPTSSLPAVVARRPAGADSKLILAKDAPSDEPSTQPSEKQQEPYGVWLLVGAALLGFAAIVAIAAAVLLARRRA